MPRAAYLNPNALWGAVLARTLANLGLRHVTVSPGSRSTPLAAALVEQAGLEVTVALDERAAAFHALGVAKATRRPAALLCTSGTAAANYLPAVVEARLSGVPLLVLTADRPPELRECRSGQTIRQPGIYGSHVVWEAELAVPAAGRWDRTVVVTHFAPSLRSADPRYGKQPGTASFCNADDDLIPRADLWLHGHLHCRHDYLVHRPGLAPARVVCQARGLEKKGEATGHDPVRLIEL